MLYILFTAIYLYIFAAKLNRYTSIFIVLGSITNIRLVLSSAAVLHSLLHSHMFPDRWCVSNLGAELVELSVLVTGNDELSQRSPHSAGNLALTAGYRQVGLVVLCREREREGE